MTAFWARFLDGDPGRDAVGVLAALVPVTAAVTVTAWTITGSCRGRRRIDGSKEVVMTTLWARFWSEQDGQDLIEYCLMLAFVALASIALFLGAEGSVNAIWSTTNSQLSMAVS